MADALPGLVAGTVLAARHLHTALTVQPFPAWVTPGGKNTGSGCEGAWNVGSRPAPAPLPEEAEQPQVGAGLCRQGSSQTTLKINTCELSSLS